MASFTLHLPRGLPAVSSSSRQVVSRTFASSSSTRDGGRDLGRDDRKSSFIDDARRNGGFRAAKDKDGNPIGREGGILYRQWLEGEGRTFRNAKPHKTNWLGGEVVEFVFLFPLLVPALIFVITIVFIFCERGCECACVFLL
jgi:hypothetical protein